MRKILNDIFGGYSRVGISLLSILLLLLFFRYIGVKGILGFLLGMAVMAFLLLSRNKIISTVVGMAGSSDYVEELRKKPKRS